jgi:hypothetical protein
MSSIPQTVMDSVKSLGLNGSSEKPNGQFAGDIKIRNICCVGAGYVGTFLCLLARSLPSHALHI